MSDPTTAEHLRKAMRHKAMTYKQRQQERQSAQAA